MSEKLVNPLDLLTDEQKDKMSQLRKISDSWGLDKPEQDFVDDMCLYRFLLGLHWDVSIAEKQLKETCDWRKDYKPQDVKLKDVEAVAKQGYLYHFGMDKKQRPIVYLVLGKDKADNTDALKLMKFKYIVYIMEQCILEMPKEVYSITWVIDASNCSLTMGLIKSMKDMFTKLGDYYTERLSMAFVCNVPWSVSFLWSFIKPFLAKETVAKYVFVKGTPAKLKPQFTPYIDEEQLVKDYGGSAKFDFNYDDELKAEEERLEKLESKEKEEEKKEEEKKEE